MGTPQRGPNLPCFRFERELTSAESWGRSLTRESSRTEVVHGMSGKFTHTVFWFGV